MTAIAVVEWEPRICGAVEWARHFVAGARSAGYNVDLVTASKSGKWLAAWPDSMRSEFVVHRLADLAAVLDTYDLVILSDIACWSARVVSPRRPGVPAFVDVLAGVRRTPITAMYHGGTYPPKLDPTLAAIPANVSCWSDVLLTTREPYARRRLATVGGYDRTRYVSHPYLPVDIDRVRPDRTRRKRRGAIMTARIAVNKGQNLAMLFAARYGFRLDLWGYNSFGLPSIGYRLWELGLALGLDPTTAKPALPKSKSGLTHPNAHKFYTGAFEFRGQRGARIAYHDEYHELDEIDWSPAVHLSLPSAEFGGSIEYVTLEAILRGSVAITPEVAVELPRYGGGRPTVTVPMTKATVWPTKTLDDIRVRSADPLDDIGDTINWYVRRASLAELERVNDGQRELVEKYHDARKVARKLIRGLEKTI